MVLGLIRRGFVRATAGLLLLGIVAGLPAALIAFIGWPLPSRWPTGDQLSGWITTPVTDTVILNALAVAAWLLWAALLHAIAAEARAAWRGMPTRATTGRTANPYGSRRQRSSPPSPWARCSPAPPQQAPPPHRPNPPSPWP